MASKKASGFSAEYEEFLTYIAGHLGPAIRNADLYRTAQERAERIGISAEIARVVGSELEPEELFRTIVREIRRVVPCERCIISSVEPDTLNFHYWHTVSDVELGDNQLENNLAKWLIRELYEPLKPLHSQNTVDSPHAQMRQLAEAGLTATLLIPVSRDGRCIAHLALSSTHEGAFSAEQEELLTSITEHLGPAIRNATLYRESEVRGRRLATLVDVAQRITRGLDLKTVLESIVEVSAMLFGGEAGFRIRDGDHMILVATTHKARGRVAHKISAQESISGKVAESGEAFITKDSESDPEVLRFRTRARRNQESVSLMCVPVKLGERVLGSLHIHREAGYEFDEDAVSIATSLADQGAIAIENARLHEEAQRSREFLNRVVSDSGNPIIIVDTEGKIIL